MATAGGPKVIADNTLALHLDAGSTKSFPGEPTTNVVTNWNLDTGWAKGYTEDIVFNEIAPPEGVNAPTVGFRNDDTGGVGYWYSYGDYAPQDPSTTYTVSLYARTNQTNGNVRIAAYTANNSEVGRQWTSYTYITQPNVWQRIVWDSFTTPSNTQSDSLSFQYRGLYNGGYTRLWLCAPQMEAKSYATPFVAGTRGTTVATGGGWRDRSGNGRHAQIVNGPTARHTRRQRALILDGTNDYIDLGSDITFKSGGGWSVLSWVKFHTVPGAYNNTTSPGNFIGSGTITHNSWYWSVLSGNLALWNRSPGTWRYGSTTLQADTWYHCVLTSSDNGTSYQMYLNGIAEGGNHTTYSWNASYAGLRVRYIGRGNSSNIRQIDGEIGSTQIYTRELTGEEVYNIYNAQRRRYVL
jgi:hypothetical protein